MIADKNKLKRGYQRNTYNWGTPPPSFTRGGTGLANEEFILIDKQLCLYISIVSWYLTVYMTKRQLRSIMQHSHGSLELIYRQLSAMAHRFSGNINRIRSGQAPETEIIPLDSN